MTEIASLVLFAASGPATAEFYRTIGLDLEDERHDEGPVHYAAELGPVHFAIYPADSAGQAPPRRGAGSSFAGFYVDSLDTVTAALTRLGAAILGVHEQVPWGCRVVAQDPDGRAVEINQRGHCPAG